MASSRIFSYRGHLVTIWEKSYRIDFNPVVHCPEGNPATLARHSIDGYYTWKRRLALWLDERRDRIAMLPKPVPGWLVQYALFGCAIAGLFMNQTTKAAIYISASMIVGVIRRMERERRK